MSRVELALPQGEALVIDDAPWASIAERVPAGGHPPVRLAWAAAHVIMRDDYAGVPHAPDRPGPPGEIAAHVDWEATAAFRRRLDRLGLGVAEAMDTAQRYELGWDSARRLVETCGGLGLGRPFIAGAGTDHLPAVGGPHDLARGVAEQCGVISAAGGIPMVLAMPWLSRHRAAPDDYVRVYRGIVERTEGPLLVHWLGSMFLPELEGYFPGDSFERVMALDPRRVRGAKLSLLDAARERRLRGELARRGQIMLTGDDLHFASLIEGEGPPERQVELAGLIVPLGDFSHALLGVLDAVAAPAALALRCLAAGRREDYRAIMVPCEALGRRLFEPPTRHYKAGLAFLSWLNGHQDTAMLPNHEETSRSREHLLDVVGLAVAAGAIGDASIAAERLRAWLAEPRRT